MKKSLVSIIILVFCWGNSYAQTYTLGDNTIVLKLGRYRDSLIVNENISIRIYHQETEKLLLKNYFCLCDWEKFENSLKGSPSSFMKKYKEPIKQAHCISYSWKNWVWRKCWRVAPESQGIREAARELLSEVTDYNNPGFLIPKIEIFLGKLE